MLTKRVSVDFLQRTQDRLAALAGVSVCVCTPDGRPITRPSWGSKYSELIATSERGRAAFEVKLAAVAADRTVPSMCHEGMSLYAAAIKHDGMCLGYLVVGSRPAVPPSDVTMRRAAELFHVDLAALREAAETIDPWSPDSPEATHRFADLLAEMIGTHYGQAETVEGQLADLRTVHGLADMLSGTRDLAEILDVTVKRVVGVMPVKACAIRLLDRKTGELVIKAVCNLSEEYLNKGPITLEDSTIDQAAFAGEAVYLEDCREDSRMRYPEITRREGIVSGLCVPMTYRGETIGVVRVYTDRPYRFTAEQESLLRSIGSQAASAIITSRLLEERVRAERFQMQVKAAGEIQARMMPRNPPEHPGLGFGFAYAPTLKVGGDFYDVVELYDGTLGVCIADVVGKGMPAALMMASIRSALRANVSVPNSVDNVAKVNQHMCRDTLASEFATLFYGVFAKDGRSFVYTNAGHVPPLLFRGNEIRSLTIGGLVLGVDPAEVYEEEWLDLTVGDVIVMTTDGVIEAMDFDGQTYGHARLRESIVRHRDLDAPHLAQQILWDVRRFVGLAKQSDDITIVVVKVV